MPIDKSRPPYNLSRHPDSDGGVRWSPDGKLLAFTGRRYDDETDIYYVWLRKSDDQILSRKRKLDKAVETLGKLRPKPKPKPAPKKEPAPVQKPAQSAGDEENGLLKALRMLFGEPASQAPSKAASKPVARPAPEKNHRFQLKRNPVSELLSILRESRTGFGEYRFPMPQSIPCFGRQTQKSWDFPLKLRVLMEFSLCSFPISLSVRRHFWLKKSQRQDGYPGIAVCSIPLMEFRNPLPREERKVIRSRLI